MMCRKEEKKKNLKVRLTSITCERDVITEFPVAAAAAAIAAVEEFAA